MAAFRCVSGRCRALSRRRRLAAAAPVTLRRPHIGLSHATAPPHALASVTLRSPHPRALEVRRVHPAASPGSRALVPSVARRTPKSCELAAATLRCKTVRPIRGWYAPTGGCSTIRRSCPHRRSKLAARGNYEPDAAPGARPRSSRRLGRPSPPRRVRCPESARRRATSSPPRRRRGEAPPLTRGPTRAPGRSQSSRA